VKQKFEERLATLQESKCLDTYKKIEVFALNVLDTTLERWLPIPTEQFKDQLSSQVVVGWVVDQPTVKPRATKIKWIVNLANTIAEAHFCQAAFRNRTTEVTFIGRRDDARAAELAYSRILPAIERLASYETSSFRWKCLREGPDPPPLCYRPARGYRARRLTEHVQKLKYAYQKHRDRWRVTAKDRMEQIERSINKRR
jgi:hypothetical protein